MAITIDPRPPSRVAVPATLHIGSGKNWQRDWLNLDVDPRWRPDCIYDLNLPLPASGQVVLPTERFGDVMLGEGCCDRIIAQDVLEHLRELTTAMTTLLHWLRPGGVLEIGVPHELSLGAWSDPTHVRAFNERSFDYFTRWSWYLGWRTHHFAMTMLEFVPSEYGQELSGQGRSLDELLRTPRALDQIRVELTKQALSEHGRQVTAHYLERPLR